MRKELVERVISRAAPVKRTLGAFDKAVLKTVSDRFGVSEELMLSTRKGRTIVDARHAAWFFINKLLGKSYSHIAEMWGSDHHVIRYGVLKIEQILDAYRDQLTEQQRITVKRIKSTWEFIREELDL